MKDKNAQKQRALQRLQVERHIVDGARLAARAADPKDTLGRVAELQKRLDVIDSRIRGCEYVRKPK